MAVVHDTLDLATHTVTSVIVPGTPSSDAILHLLAHMAFSDGALHSEELSFLAGILPGRTHQALSEWVRRVGAQKPQLEDVAVALPTDRERWTCLRFTARMAWRDGEIQDEERSFLVTLASTLQLPTFSVDRVLREMHPSRTRHPTAALKKAVEDVIWSAVRIAPGPMVCPELASVEPPGDPCVYRIAVDGVEMLGLHEGGLTAKFREGTCFLGWGEIVSHETTNELGSAIRLLTEDGVVYHLVDGRLTGLGMFIDQLAEPVRPDQPPLDVKLVIGE